MGRRCLAIDVDYNDCCSVETRKSTNIFWSSWPTNLLHCFGLACGVKAGVVPDASTADRHHCMMPFSSVADLSSLTLMQPRSQMATRCCSGRLIWPHGAPSRALNFEHLGTHQITMPGFKTQIIGFQSFARRARQCMRDVVPHWNGAFWAAKAPTTCDGPCRLNHIHLPFVLKLLLPSEGFASMGRADCMFSISAKHKNVWLWKPWAFLSTADSFDPLSCVAYPWQPDLRNLHENAWLPEMLAGKWTGILYI